MRVPHVRSWPGGPRLPAAFMHQRRALLPLPSRERVVSEAPASRACARRRVCLGTGAKEGGRGGLQCQLLEHGRVRQRSSARFSRDQAFDRGTLAPLSSREAALQRGALKSTLCPPLPPRPWLRGCLPRHGKRWSRHPLPRGEREVHDRGSSSPQLEKMCGCLSSCRIRGAPARHDERGAP
jgi:hypothetical protein